MSACTNSRSVLPARPALLATNLRKNEILLSNIKYITAREWILIFDDKSLNIDQIVPLTLLFLRREGMKMAFPNLGITSVPKEV